MTRWPPSDPLRHGAGRAGHPAVDPPDRPGAAVRRGGRRRWPPAAAWSRPSCTGSPAATRSTSPRCCGPATGEVPPSARDAVLARVARLGAEAREVLDVGRADRRPGRARAAGARPTDGPASTLDELLALRAARRRRRAGCGSGTRSPGSPSSRRSPPHRRRRHPRPDPRRAARGRAATTTRGLAFHAEGAGDGPAVLEHAVRGGAAGGRARLAPRGGGAVRAGAALRGRRRPADAGRRCTTGWPTSTRCSTGGTDAADANERALALWREAGDAAARGRHDAPATRDPVAPVPGARVERHGRRAVATCWSRSGRAGSWRCAYLTRGHACRASEHREAGAGAGQRARRAGRARSTSRRSVSDALNTEAASPTAGARSGSRRCTRRSRSRSPTAWRRRPAGPTPTCYINSRVRPALRRGRRVLRRGIAFCDDHEHQHVRHLPARRPGHPAADDRPVGRGGGHLRGPAAPRSARRWSTG